MAKALKLHKYILLNDKEGDCTERGFLQSEKVPCKLLKGEILEALVEAEQPEDAGKIALTGIANKNLKLVCPTTDVARLSASKADLLMAITSTKEKYRIFREKNRLKQGKRLTVDSKVYVKAERHLEEVEGKILYKGPLPTYKGTMFAVDLLGKDAVHGTTGSSYRGNKYFEHQQDYTVVVALDKLRPRSDTHQSNPPKNEYDLIDFSDEDQFDTQGERDISSDPKLSNPFAAFLNRSIATKRQSREDTERRQQNCIDELHATLATERESREDTERRLLSGRDSLYHLQTTLATEIQSREDTERRLQNSLESSNQLQITLITERQSHEDTESRLQNSIDELQTTLATERQSREDTERHLQNSIDELHATLATERQSCEDMERRLHLEEERSIVLRASLEDVDWMLDRSDILLSDNVIGVGAWARVMEGTFRSCEVAVKQIHELILSPHNRRLFEREISIASRCRHPCLLQFIG